MCLIALNNVTNLTEPEPQKKKKVKKQTKDNVKQLDVTSNLATKKNVQLVRTDFLWQYVEHDRNVVKIPGRAKNYLNKLKVAIKKEGLRHPLILSISKKTERAYLYEGNHRLAVLRNEGVQWVPLKVQYYFLNDDYDQRFRYIPRSMHDNWPENPTPEQVGFETKSLDAYF